MLAPTAPAQAPPAKIHAGLHVPASHAELKGRWWAEAATATAPRWSRATEGRTEPTGETAVEARLSRSGCLEPRPASTGIRHALRQPATLPLFYGHLLHRDYLFDPRRCTELLRDYLVHVPPSYASRQAVTAAAASTASTGREQRAANGPAFNSRQIRRARLPSPCGRTA